MCGNMKYDVIPLLVRWRWFLQDAQDERAFAEPSGKYLFVLFQVIIFLRGVFCYMRILFHTGQSRAHVPASVLSGGAFVGAPRNHVRSDEKGRAISCLSASVLGQACGRRLQDMVVMKTNRLASAR